MGTKARSLEGPFKQDGRDPENCWFFYQLGKMTRRQENA